MQDERPGNVAPENMGREPRDAAMSEPRELHEILRCTVGSELHGLAVDGTDDHDEMGIFIEPPDSVFSPRGFPLEHDVWRSKPEGVRSDPGDTDLVRYSLRKYLRLAVRGNPTILLPLFAPPEAFIRLTAYGDSLLAQRPKILSKAVGPRFLGYMDSQIARLEGRKKMPTTRQELIDRYGYDTKFASHAVRLGRQGVELLTTGSISLPIREPDLSIIRSIKMGAVAFDEVLHGIRRLRVELAGLVDENRSVLPDSPDFDALARWSRRIHEGAWE